MENDPYWAVKNLKAFPGPELSIKMVWNVLPEGDIKQAFPITVVILIKILHFEVLRVELIKVTDI